MELCPAMGLEPADRLWVRISEQTKVDNIVVGVCYRPHNQEEVDEVFFRQPAEVSCLQALVFLRQFNHPDTCWRYNTAGQRQCRRCLERTDVNFLKQVIKKLMKEDAPHYLILTNKE